MQIENLEKTKVEAAAGASAPDSADAPPPPNEWFPQTGLVGTFHCRNKPCQAHG